jgi:hypothetical protein
MWALGEAELAQVLEGVRTFDDFTRDNDPHGEHDFGNFVVGGVTYFFKVDYYAPDIPSRPPKTRPTCVLRRMTKTRTTSEPTSRAASQRYSSRSGELTFSQSDASKNPAPDAGSRPHRERRLRAAGNPDGFFIAAHA